MSETPRTTLIQTRPPPDASPAGRRPSAGRRRPVARRGRARAAGAGDPRRGMMTARTSGRRAIAVAGRTVDRRRRGSPGRDEPGGCRGRGPLRDDGDRRRPPAPAPSARTPRGFPRAARLSFATFEDDLRDDYEPEPPRRLTRSRPTA